MPTPKPCACTTHHCLANELLPSSLMNISTAALGFGQVSQAEDFRHVPKATL